MTAAPGTARTTRLDVGVRTAMQALSAAAKKGTSRTKSGGGLVPDEVYERAAKHFDEGRLAHLIGLITAINGWNRLMVSRRIPAGGTEW
ncbi:hypothetical protein GCM10011579_071040 [Streptomyces albiflavescens]|uniref:Alkylhydroperoxidase n=1 Tax=Streptomyces albiflavescens TaxID=1623582 RepID=A0A917YCH3_9ACTN|nr:hypothetical protein GCM10011579_071040 [Streptomyces albiflavescens]